MKTFNLTLKNPTEALAHWLSNSLCVTYVSNSCISSIDEEYEFSLLRFDGTSFTVKGNPVELFEEDFTELLSNHLTGAMYPCPDVSEPIETITKGAENTLRNGAVSVVQYGITDDQGKEHVSPVYLLTEQAYKYMLSKCTKDELWDLGFLGNSEEHVVKSQMPFNLKR